MIFAWILFPCVLGLISLGCGLLVAQVSGRPLPGPIVLPVGLAAVMVVLLLTTADSATARLSVPLLVALALVGIGNSFPWRRDRFEYPAALAPVGVFAVYAAPVVLSGQATFAGYIKLDDTSTWLAFIDRLLVHGRTVAGLAPSTYQLVLSTELSHSGYPVGAFLPVGVGHALIGTDSAWLIQPYEAFMAAMLALVLYELLRHVVPSRAVRAVGAFVAAQSTLLYGYSLWGGVKEVASAFVIPLVVLLGFALVRRPAPLRGVLPLAVVTSALFGILSVSGGVWLLPAFVPLAVAGAKCHGRLFARTAVAFTALAALLSIPTLLEVRAFVANTIGLYEPGGGIANLIHPLSWLQLFGIWPVGDFRLRPGDMTVTYILIAAAAAAALVVLVHAWRSRTFEIVLYGAVAIVGCLITARGGSAWVEGKAFAAATPAIVLAAIAGIALIARSGRLVEAVVLAAAVTGGVLWSNTLAYHDVWLAPKTQLSELETIDARFAGDGPTLMTDYQPYGVRHFLRDMAPESAGEYRIRPDQLRSGGEVPKGGYADIDAFQLSGVLQYRTLVLPHNGATSRPPSVYSLVWSGPYYDVWQRPESGGPQILDHFSLGTGDQPSAVPSCSSVEQVAALAARVGGQLAAVIRPPATVVPLASASFPATWQAYSGAPDVVYPASTGTLTTTFSVPASGRYGVWLSGSFRRRLTISIDGTRLASVQGRFTYPGVDVLLGYVHVAAGSHQLSIRSEKANLSPGSGGTPFALGPVTISRDTDELPVTYVAPSAARSLCGRSLDWLEAVSG